MATGIEDLIDDAGNNSAPADISIASPSWDKATQTFSATLTATDADAGDTITYSLTGPDEKLFTISNGTDLSIANPAKR